MKRVIATILTLVMTIGLCTGLPLSVTTKAAIGRCGDNLTWRYEDSTLTISGTGDMWDFVPYDLSVSEGMAPWYYIRDNYDIVIEDGVTSIGSNAFFAKFQNITLPVSVVAVRDDAVFWYAMSDEGFYGFYEGTQEQFDAIIKEDNSLNGFNWHYETDTHVPGDWDYFWFDNCESGGYRYKYCTCCGLELESEYVQGHSYVDYFCEICGEGYFDCSFNDTDKTATIYGYNTRTTKLVIPEYINGYRVTAIADCAFGSSEDYDWDDYDYDNYCITEITIPDSVTSIGRNAFNDTRYYRDSSNWVDDCLYIDDCLVRVDKAGLQGIGPFECNVREGTRLIADGAFDYADELETINVPASVEVIGEIYWNHSFLVSVNDCMDECNCRFQVSAINVAAGNKQYSSANGVLYNKDKTKLIKYPCSKADKSFVVPDSVITLGSRALHSYYLQDLTIGASVEKISYNYYASGSFFSDLYELASISVSKSNKNYVSSDGILFNADKTELICYPCEKAGVSYVIPDGIVTLDTGAFGGSDIESVVIPESVSIIMPNLFEDTPLKYVFYEGTKEKADAMLSFYLNNMQYYNVDLIYATWHYEASDHTFGNWVIDKNATVNTSGSKHRNCTQCNYKETAGVPQLKPAAPKLTKIANTTSGVQVTWGKVSGADKYIVYRKVYNAKTKTWSGWSKLNDKVTTNSYVDKTAKTGTYYLYTIKAANEAGASGYDKTGIKTYFMSTPKITSIANTSNSITIKWGKITGATGYIIYRKTDGGKWQNLGKTKSTSFTDKTAKAGITYRYTIKAYYGSYVSSYNSNGSAIRRLTTPKLISSTSQRDGVLLKWNKVTGATGYVVYRKASSGEWKAIATVKGNSKVKYLDETPRKGATYQYCIKAYYGTSKSASSNTIKLKCKY